MMYGAEILHADSCLTCVTHGLDLMLIGIIIGKVCFKKCCSGLAAYSCNCSAASSTVACGWLDSGCK